MPEFHLTAAGVGRLLRAMFGPDSVPPRDVDEERWLDDGGALEHGEDGYEHTIAPGRPAGLA